MNKAKIIWVWAIFVLALALGLQTPRAEEATSGLWGLSSTTFSGFIDTTVVFGPADGPLNDAFANAALVEGAVISTPVNLTLATVEASEPVAAQQTGSIWYKWMMATDGVARISKNALEQLQAPAATSTIPALSEESIFYPDGGITYVGSVTQFNPNHGPGEIGYQPWWTQLAAYRGNSFTDLTLIDRGEYLEFQVQAGETIWLALEVYHREPIYEGQPARSSDLPEALYLDVTPVPANDSFASTLAIKDSAGGIFAGHLLGSTREANEPNLGNEFSGGSVWFHYTAATYGTVTVHPSNTLPVAVFTGDNLSNLQLIAKSSAGDFSFFGEDGKSYHFAVYRTPGAAAGFSVNFTGPRYRLYETNLDGLMPNGLSPHFYGVRGATMLMYAKSATGWTCVEIEPIVNQAADLLMRPANAIDGQLRVITIDDVLPSPHVEFRTSDELIISDLIGYPGQTCAISFSADLVNWSQPGTYTLDSSRRAFGARGRFDGSGAYFYRVTQSMPQVNAPQVPIGIQIQTGGNHGGIPPPPVPAF